MMNSTKICAVAAITGLALATSGLASAEQFEYRGESHAAAICQAVVEDNPTELQKQIRKAARHDRLRQVASPTVESYTCNGVSVAEFAKQYDALKTLAYLGDSPLNEAIAQH